MRSASCAALLALLAACHPRSFEDSGRPAGADCEPGSCAAGLACVGGACVAAELPDAAFCDPVAEVAPDDQAAQDALLELFTEARADGAGSCDSGAAGLPALRFDPRLVCAARVLAQDMARTRARSLTDSAGRVTADRVRAAGYAPSAWAEGFALQASSAGRALQVILGDADACRKLTADGYREVGTGSFADVHVIVVGRE